MERMAASTRSGSGRRGDAGRDGAAFLSLVDGAGVCGGGGGRSCAEEESASWWQRHGLTRGADRLSARAGGELSRAAAQEFAEDAEPCFRATGECCFDVEAMEARLAELAGADRDAARTGRCRSGCRRWRASEYMVAVDPAGGGAEGDYAAVQVIELETGLQCAELQQRLGPRELARAAAELAREYSRARWWWWSGTTMAPAVLAYLDDGGAV